MGQATVDLPDPLQTNQPADAQSADDLLSQLAGNEIDRLLAESEEENPSEPSAPPVEPPAAVTQDLDTVLADAAEDRKAAEERAALQPAVVVQPAPLPVDNSPKIELGASSRLPWLVRPLEWFSSPLDPWPDQLRELLGKAGILTLVNALAVLAYVMYRRHHPH